LGTAVRDRVSGVLVDGHVPGDYAAAVRSLLAEPRRWATLAAGAVRHAADFGWGMTAERILEVYAAL
jgi:D-inositol-3-phosphate glycosyltransferase